MNKNYRRVALLIVAADVGQRLRSTLELTVVVAIVMLLAALAVRGYEVYVIRAQTAEAFMLATTVKAEMIAYRAQHGQWPDAEPDARDPVIGEEPNSGTVVDRMDVRDNGALSAVFGTGVPGSSLDGRRLTFRPLHVPSSPGSPIVWACANHGAPEGLTPTGSDETDIDATYLPYACRDY